MDQDEIRRLAEALPGTAVQVAGPHDGSPEVAWGDTFVFYDPDDREEDRRMPFATIVTKDYPGFDEGSKLDRDGVYRVNIHVGRAAMADVLDPDAAVDPAAIDTWIPHPTYAAQGWVSVVNPGDRTAAQVADLLTAAHALATDRHGRR